MKRKSKNKIPAYAFGFEQGIQMAGQIAPALASSSGDSNAMNIIGGAASGAATGFSVAGPVGGFIGAGYGMYKSIRGNQERKKAQLMQKGELSRQKTVRQQAALNAESSQMAYEYELRNPIIPTFNKGGTMGDSNLAFVDDNEIIQYPNGMHKKVQDNSGRTDNVLTKLPKGSTVFSDAMSVPGTDKTYAEAAEELSKISSRKYKNADKFARTSKKLNDKYVDKEMNKLKINQFIKRETSSKGSGNLRSVPKFAFGIEDDLPLNPMEVVAQAPARKLQLVKAPSAISPTIPSMATNPYIAPINSATVTPTTERNRKLNVGINNVQNILTDYLSLSPYRYNVSRGNEAYDVVSTLNNPYASQVSSTMRGRRASMEPIRQSINRQRAISRYNSRNMTGTGQNMAYNLASDVLADRLEVDAINNVNNTNNQYAAEYSNVMNNLGQQWVNATAYAEDATARNKAARNAYRATASTQMGQWAQNRALMDNQARRDAGMLEALKPFLREGFDSRSLQRILNQFN